MLPLQKIANCQKNSDTRTQGHNFEGVIKGMSSSKIEEVGEARRSMNAVEGFTDYGLQFTDAKPL